ncbi:reverse transcriptase domain-containing protein [Trichonephila clavipes]|nr:reverse transcriptase domain-containing protein [Trichonephila clavipes]
MITTFMYSKRVLYCQAVSECNGSYLEEEVFNAAWTVVPEIATVALQLRQYPSLSVSRLHISIKNLMTNVLSHLAGPDLFDVGGIIADRIFEFSIFVLQPLNTTLKGIAAWAENLKLTINAGKSNCCIFSTDRRRRSSFNVNIKIQNSQIKKVDLPTYLGVNLDPELRFSKYIEQTANKALGKLNILRILSRTSWGSRPQTLKSTFSTVIRPVLEYATPICTPASISVKQKLDYVQHRAAKIIIGAVSSTNNEKAEQECGLPPLESRRKLATIKFTNKLRSYGLNHISRRVFDKWKHSTRLKRSSTLPLDSEIRKELIWDHSSLEFFQEPLIPKNPPKNTCFELELLQPCSKKEDPVTYIIKGDYVPHVTTFVPLPGYIFRYGIRHVSEMNF